MARALMIKEKPFTVFQVVVIGCGGNGSHFVRNLLQTLATYKSKSDKMEMDLTIVDADKVESHNTDNQLFDDDDVGEYKVISLAERYGYHYNIEVKRVTDYVTNLEMLDALFPQLEVSKRAQVVKIIFGMVDNDRTRQLIDTYFHSDEVTDLIWIDSGIEGVTVFDKPRSQEQKIIDESGFGGQTVCGFKYKGEVLTQPVTRVYPNIMENELTAFPGQSCGQLIINNPQRLLTNQMAAQTATMYMNNLLHLQSIFYHEVNFNAQLAQSKPRLIPQETIDRFEALKKGIAPYEGKR